MKKIVLFISLVFSVCGLRAQDTINPFTLNPATLPVLRDSAYRLHLNLAGNDSAYPSRYISCNAHIFDSFSWVTGLNIAMSFRDNLLNDSVVVRGVLIKIHDKDYEHPEYHFTRPVISNSRRPFDRYMAFDNPGCFCPVDTVLPVYSLYFEHSIEVSDTAFIGMCVWDTTKIPENAVSWRFEGINNYRITECDSMSLWFLQRLPTGHFFVDDSNRVHVESVGWNNIGILCIFPIFTLPDTDDFACPEVEGFGFGGMMAGSAIFGWSASAEQGLFQMAYGPYDSPLDSLQVVETSNSYMELSERQLSPDIYYQARLRARCRHACPVHDTVMWSPWTDPIFFYTGDHMPDTSHHQPPEPEGIATVGGAIPFVLAPNPAHGSATLTLDHTPAPGTILTVYDATGREVLRLPLHDRATRFTTENLAAGFYTVTVSDPQGMSTRRLSVE